jgi:hypothetical protein
MRLTAFTAVAFALAGLALPAAAADPSADVATTYTVHATLEPATLKAGAAGTLRLAIEPVGTVHVDPKAPIKVTLTATPGLSLGKAQLGRADAVPAGQGVTFAAPVTAATAGRQEVKAKLDFFVCTDQWCVKQARELTVAVDVR